MSSDPHLVALIHEASSALPEVTRRKMFGCDGWFANGEIYALVWKEGRIGVRLPEEATFNALLAQPGADRWRPGGKMTMRHWLLVPVSFHADVEKLRPWIARAHAAARAIKAARAAKRPRKTAPPTQS